jgi:hypothetical protein
MNLTLALILATTTGLGFDPGYGARGELSSKYIQVAMETTQEAKHGGTGLTYRGTLTGLVPVYGNLSLTPALTYQGYRTSFPSGTVWAKAAVRPGIGLRYKMATLSYFHDSRDSDGGPAVILEIRLNHKRLHAYGSLGKTWWGGGTGTRGAVGIGMRVN